MSSKRLAAATLAVVSLVTVLGACADSSDNSSAPCAAAVAHRQDNVPGIIQATYRPRPPRQPVAPTSRPHTQQPVKPAPTTVKPQPTSTKTSAPSSKPTTATPTQGSSKLKLSNKRVSPPGETPYFPPLMVLPSDDNYAKVVNTYRTLTRASSYRSPVTKHVYVYHSPSYFAQLSWQDLYNPFDPRNWTNPMSPFYTLQWEQDGELEFPDIDDGQADPDSQELPADDPSC